jgi:hypothetical protein
MNLKSSNFFDARRAGLALALGASIALSSTSAHAQSIAVQLNGAPVTFSEAPPVNAAGSVLVPMRGVFEAMQAQVRFVASTNTIIATRGQREIQLSLGSTQAFVNGSPVALSQAARSIGGRTFVPLRFVADALGARVGWNAATNTVSIEDPELGGGTRPNTQPATPNVPTVVLERVDTQDPARVVVRDNGALRSYDLAANAEAFRQVGSGAQFGPLVPIELTDLRAGEDVRITQANGLVTQIVARRSVRGARVRSVNGNRIVLDDGTTVTVSQRVRFFDAEGRESTIPANLTPNTPVALYVRPSTGVVYAVSAAQSDVSSADFAFNTGNTGNNTGNNTLPDDGDTLPGGNTLPNTGGNTGAGSRITQVRHSAARPVAAGVQINVEVRGTAGARGTFDLSPRLRNLPLREEQPGIYRGTYTVRAGDDVLNSFVTARLAGAGAANEDVAQSRDPLTIDTVPPRVIDFTPRNGSIVNDARPTFIAGVADTGGSGLASARLTITPTNGATFELPMTVVPPSRAQVTLDRPLSGRIAIRVTVTDAAGNSSESNGAVTLQARAGAITSVVHDATRPLRRGSTLTVDMRADQGGRATFDLLDERGQIVAQRVPMTEVNPGRYRGTQILQDLPNADSLRVRARYDDGGGAIDTLEAANPVPIARDARDFSITSPTAEDAAGTSVTVRGRGTPGALVDVSVTAKGVRTLFGIIGYQPYQQVLDTRQVQVDAAGNWTVGPIALTKPRNVAQLSYDVSAVQTDEGNIKSQSQTVTINAAQ